MTARKALKYSITPDCASNEMADLEYKMASHPVGICLIINNQHFQKDSKRRRHGTEVDTEILKETFETLSFTIRERDNQTAKDMKDDLADISSTDHSNMDCFVCCILSRGDYDVVEGTDGVTVQIDDLRSAVTAAACPGLRGKPKIFIIQTGAGYDRQTGYILMQRDSVDRGRPSAAEADFLTIHAMVPGHSSSSLPTRGSPFVQILSRHLMAIGHPTNIEDIIRRVNYDSCKDTPAYVDNTDSTVSAVYKSTLRKKVILRRLNTTLERPEMTSPSSSSFSVSIPRQLSRSETQPSQSAAGLKKGPGEGKRARSKSRGQKCSTSENVETVQRIADLKDTDNKWCIKARVMSMSDRLTKDNAPTQCTFNLSFVDHSGEVDAVGHTDFVYKKLKHNKVYLLKGTSFSPKKDRSKTSKLRLVLQPNTDIRECPEEEDVPPLEYSFVSIQDIPRREDGDFIDVIGVVRECRSEVTSPEKSKKRTSKAKCEVRLADRSWREVMMYGQETVNVAIGETVIIAVQDVKVSHSEGLCWLSMDNDSRLTKNPRIPEADDLRAWYERVGRLMPYTNLGSRV